jgi:hypothetical protein
MAFSLSIPACRLLEEEGDEQIVGSDW